MTIITTGETDDHSHTIDIDEESGLTSKTNGHAHPYTLGREMTEEGGDNQHTHSIPDFNEETNKTQKTDELEMLKLFNKALKQFSGSPAQKKTIKALNVIRKRNGLKMIKEDVELTESIVGGLIFNSRRDEQSYKKSVFLAKVNEASSIIETVTGKFSSGQINDLRKSFKDIKKINPDSKSFRAVRALLDTMTQEQLKQISGAKINFISSLATNRVGVDKENMKEGVAANFAGGQPNPNIAGLDEPFRKRKKDEFAGHKVFEVDSETFSMSIKGRPKFARLKKFMSLEDFPNVGQDIREFASKNPKKSIILRDINSNRMLFLKGFTQ